MAPSLAEPEAYVDRDSCRNCGCEVTRGEARLNAPERSCDSPLVPPYIAATEQTADVRSCLLLR